MKKASFDFTSNLLEHRADLLVQRGAPVHRLEALRHVALRALPKLRREHQVGEHHALRECLSGSQLHARRPHVLSLPLVLLPVAPQKMKNKI